MNRQLWRRWERVVLENGIVIGVMFFFTFMAWILFWPYGPEGKALDIRSAEAARYEKVKASYSEHVADLMRGHEYFFEQSLSILKPHRLNCLLSDHVETADKSKAIFRALRVRREGLCEVSKEAADMVDTYAERLKSADPSSAMFLRFFLVEEGEEEGGAVLSLPRRSARQLSLV
ncbi:hypothetical protein [Halomonas sp. BC04]|uniref:hypothetical protein n=1 Tax=Halomonas sp. BC04 TaxID=1403540 RepID=UPI0003ED897B|nr:hypothetical protein [Halomonas sp. BC04]EWG98688.1 hypothetical protein Q427_29210 [Halomonas sp. BC04]